jgi:hypothetical protein
MTMKRASTAALALFAVISAASADSAHRAAGPKEFRSATALESSDASTSLKTSNIVRSPSLCLPDVAEPVWGAGNALLGFSCSSNNN